MPPIFNTPEGHSKVNEILATHGVHPHDYQLEGIAVSLDGEDVVATMATGSGKTGFYTFLMLVIQAIARDSSLSLGDVRFPEQAAMLLVVPTRALQEDMKRSMNSFGLDAVVLNRDSLAAHRGLWDECQLEHSVLLISPELLTSTDFTTKLLNSTAFQTRLCRFGVDEMHLVHSWSGFRDSFNQIGFMRVRLGPTKTTKYIPLIATTATLREGNIKKGIYETLGIDTARHHLIRRSNRRAEIQIIVREMLTAAGLVGFRELEWVLSSKRNTVIFCRTIGLATKIAIHLFNVGIAKKLPDLDKRIRTFTAVNWASFNTQALHSLNDKPYATITVATDVLSVGWDNRYIQDVIVYGEPDNIDEFVQKIGRAGRDALLLALQSRPTQTNIDGPQHCETHIRAVLSR
ncbi:hypothetical protein NMY22_g623 [Coprinellus aureogranulatus]|nr:hypothetical protein NMY22_g623 [Coprinellus aureogranulatus]